MDIALGVTHLGSFNPQHSIFASLSIPKLMLIFKNHWEFYDSWSNLSKLYCNLYIYCCRLEGLLSMGWQQRGNMGWEKSSICWRMSLSSPWHCLAVLVWKILLEAMWGQSMKKSIHCSNKIFVALGQCPKEKWFRSSIIPYTFVITLLTISHCE